MNTEEKIENLTKLVLELRRDMLRVSDKCALLDTQIDCINSNAGNQMSALSLANNLTKREFVAACVLPALISLPRDNGTFFLYQDIDIANAFDYADRFLDFSNK